MAASFKQTHFVDRLKQGDEGAATPLWHSCVQRIMAIARRKLGTLPRRISDEEDIALSAFHSFCRGAANGKFAKLNNRQDLWNILAVIISRKVNRQIEYLTAQKRGPGQVRGDSVFLGNDSIHRAGLAQFPDNQPPADVTVMLEEEFEQLLEQLYDQQLRQIALMKLEGYSNQEIAEHLGRHTRSVERKLKIIRDIWSAGSACS